jgi:hypothetical protein
MPSLPEHNGTSTSSIREQLLAYLLLNPQDERIQDFVDTICGKFRATMSMLSIHLDYEGYP